MSLSSPSPNRSSCRGGGGAVELECLNVAKFVGDPSFEELSPADGWQQAVAPSPNQKELLHPVCQFTISVLVLVLKQPATLQLPAQAGGSTVHSYQGQGHHWPSSLLQSTVNHESTVHVQLLSSVSWC